MALERREFLGLALGLAAAPALPVLSAGAAPAPWFDFAIAGGPWHGLEAVRDRLLPGTTLAVARDPENPHDPRAVAILGPGGGRIGYIPRAANADVAAALDSGHRFVALVVGRLVWGAIPDGLRFTGFAAGDPLLRLLRVA
jgi:hypothetical protein